MLLNSVLWELDGQMAQPINIRIPLDTLSPDQKVMNIEEDKQRSLHIRTQQARVLTYSDHVH